MSRNVKMHEDEVELSETLVQQLIAAQFPDWAGLPVRRVTSSGTDNALFRLGEHFVVRMPRIRWAAGQVEKEQQWLLKLAPCLPLLIPTPVAMGSPCDEYPWVWSVYRWLEGDEATAATLADLDGAAKELAEFLVALRSVDATGGQPPGDHNSGRGVPLRERDAAVRKAISESGHLLDAAAVTYLWERAMDAPPWEGAGVWIHGDLQPGNLLVRDGRLAAVIDFGCLGVGDPACDLMVAWNLLDARSRPVFRESVGLDDSAWERGRGWALSCALIYIPYYLESNPSGVALARRTVEELIVFGR